tara:strand:- start:97 stop:318 length:222 start_codon:yes stop_codon:yes gene_type:complete
MEAHVETDQEYIDRVMQEELISIHATLLECLNGNVNEDKVNEALRLVAMHVGLVVMGKHHYLCCGSEAVQRQR